MAVIIAILEYLLDAGFIFPIRTSLSHCLFPKKTRWILEDDSDFRKVNQVVILIAATVINVLSFLEQNNMAAGAGKRSLIKQICSLIFHKEGQEQFSLTKDR